MLKTQQAFNMSSEHGITIGAKHILIKDNGKVILKDSSLDYILTKIADRMNNLELNKATPEKPVEKAKVVKQPKIAGSAKSETPGNEKPKCAAHTKDGKKCINNAIDGKLCGIHKKALTE